jgi:hypothetical protein
LIGGAEIDAAHDRRGAIRHQYFAMIAAVEADRVEWIDGVEFDNLDAGALQAREEFRHGGVGAIAVIDNVDRNALLPLGGQQVAQPFPVGFDVLQDIIFQIDGGLGAFDGSEHGGKCLAAIH